LSRKICLAICGKFAKACLSDYQGKNNCQ